MKQRFSLGFGSMGKIMPYKPESDGWMKGLVGFGLTILIVAIAGAVARVGTREAINYAQSSPSSIEADLENTFADNPSIASMFYVLKEKYPSDYEALISGFSEKVRGGASGAEINVYAHSFMRSFAKSSKKDFSAAPQQNLIEVLEKHVPLLDALSKDSSSICAEFVTTGLGPGRQLSTPTLEAMAEVVSLQIKAAAAGRDSPAPRQPPSDSDWEQVGSAMLEYGTLEEELNSLANQTYSTLPVDRQCEVGKALYRAMASLPPEGAARMAAYVLIQD
ncbi:hypothetical protein OIK40_01525 [Erythrobacter sp. sf7]|uniref:Uncharacterized protein n=1 Tax=Erythrobacter fulvus TaxID=2987523 RepID=A0ABT5JL70_9SPHN|nr:hypothetical protein [Erythrobacter fulvus]